MTDIETAWVAGLIEGEGCLGLYKLTGARKGRRRGRITVNMTDEDVVLKLHALTGVGHVRMNNWHAEHKLSHYKRKWIWEVGRQIDVTMLLLRLLSHLGQRRLEKAILILDYCADSKAVA